MKIELPSGAIIEARKLKLGVLQELADSLEDDADASEFFALLHNAWLQCVDPGPYPEHVMARGTKEPDWAKVLKGDLLGALFQIRIGTFRDGHMYPFEVPCQHDKSCEPIKWEIDLADLVKNRVRRLPEASIEHVRTGEPLIARLYNPDTGEHDGPAVSFRLQTIENELSINELRKKQLDQERRKSPASTVVDQLAAQILAVEGQNLGRSPGNERRVWHWLKGTLDLEDGLDLQAAFEEADCGYETEIIVKCKQCRRSQKVDLPLQRTFLVPSRRPKRPMADDEAGPPSS